MTEHGFALGGRQELEALAQTLDLDLVTKHNGKIMLTHAKAPVER
jgi:hypothetical protein